MGHPPIPFVDCRTTAGGEDRGRRKLLRSPQVTGSGSSDQGGHAGHGETWSVHGSVRKVEPLDVLEPERRRKERNDTKMFDPSS